MRRVVVEIIEADFAPSDDLGMLREAGEFVEMPLRNFFGFVRVDANAGIDPIVLFGEWNCGVTFFRARAGAYGEDGVDAGIASALQHGLAIVCELGKVNVGVGVD